MHLIKVYFTILVSIWLYQSVIAQGASRNLIEDSPFLPPGYQTAAERAKQKPPPPKPIPQKKSELVLKGYYRLGGVWRFCLMDKKTSKSHWVVQGDEPPLGLEGLTINNFDEEGFLSYTYNGQSGELELASPSSSPASIQTGGTKPKTSSRSIPGRNTSPRPTPVRSTKPIQTTAKVTKKPNLPTVMVGGAQPTQPQASSVAPKAPPATKPPNFIPQLPPNIAAQLPSGISNAMRDAEDRGQATAVQVSVSKPVTGTPQNPKSEKPTITIDAGPVTTSTPSVFTNPGTNPGSPPVSQPGSPKMIPRRASLNLPPGIPPPPTTAPPSLPEFLRVGGPPPTPPPSKKP